MTKKVRLLHPLAQHLLDSDVPSSARDALQRVNLGSALTGTWIWDPAAVAQLNADELALIARILKRSTHVEAAP